MKLSRIAASVLTVAILSVMVTDTIGQDGRPERRGGPGGGGEGRGGPGGGGFGRGGGGNRGGGGRGGGDPTMSLLRVEEVQAELQISPDQEEAIDKLSERARERPEGIDFSKIREMPEEERNELFGKMREDQEKKLKEAKEMLEEVLLPQQIERLSQIALQQRGVQALGDEEIAEELGLSEEQKGKLVEVRDGLRESMRERMQEMMREANAEGGGGFDREMFTKIREEIEEEVLDVLTSEQRAKFEEMKGEPFEMPARDPGRGGFGGRGGPGGGGGGRGGADGGGRGGDRGGRGGADGGGRGGRGGADGGGRGGDRRQRPQTEE